MTDIVERLRLYDKRLIDVHLAADEIERLCDVERVQDKEIKRLKDALEEIATGHRCNGWYIEGSKAARIAQDAIRNQTDDLYT